MITVIVVLVEAIIVALILMCLYFNKALWDIRGEVRMRGLEKRDLDRKMDELNKLLHDVDNVLNVSKAMPEDGRQVDGEFDELNN